MKLAVNPVTDNSLRLFQASPSHSLLLVGPKGAGKLSLATRLAKSLLEIEKLDDYPFARHITAGEGTSIGIEAIRELEHFMSLKVPSRRSLNRIIIIEAADLMTAEAQNALLKTLEEPPQDTVLILTASHSQALLPTIRSRVQQIHVNRPERAHLLSSFDVDFADDSFDRAYAMSGGLPGLMHAILSQEEHSLVAAAKLARQLLGQSTYERLQHVDELAKQRELTSQLTYILQQMAHVSLQTAQGSTAQKWQRIMRASYEASEALANSAQPKLVLTNLMLNL